MKTTKKRKREWIKPETLMLISFLLGVTAVLLRFGVNAGILGAAYILAAMVLFIQAYINYKKEKRKRK